MQGAGRRRSGALSSFTICLFCLCFFAATANAAVLGLDFGTLNIKAALVKPGIPLDIVLTKDSKRKETAALAFKPNRDEKNAIITTAGTFPERAYGSDALALQGRMPGEVFPNLKLLLGLQSDEDGTTTTSTYSDRYPAVQLQQVKELGTTMFKSSAFADDVVPFSVEELIGMELASIKRNAEAMAGKGSSVEDVVITIPPFYTADEKRAIVKAATFAGLTVNALITDGLAVGLDYAKSREFPDITKDGKPEYHLIYEMGAGSTTATVMRFQSKSVKDVGRYNKTVQDVAVVGSGWDRTLGGDSLNHAIMDDYITKLLTKPVFKNRGTQRQEITSNGRVMSRIYKEAERARQVLSANIETTSGFEELLPDIDFRTKLSRTDFEKLAADFAERVEGPISDALAMAKLTMADIDSVILHGGAVRTPFVQKKLEGIVGDTAKLRSNVNPDESAVFGAAFKAASLSPSFKVKEIRHTDIAGYAATLIYTDSGKERKNTLFNANSPVGSGAPTKQITFKNKDDFVFSFVQNVGGKDRSVLSVKTENLTASVQELTKQFGCEKDQINTKMSIRLNNAYGLPEVIAGSVSCEVDDVKSGSVGDTVKDWLGFGKKKDQQPLGEGEEEDAPIEEADAASSATVGSDGKSSPSTSGASSSTSSKAAEAKKRTEIIPLKWTVQVKGNPQPSAEELSRMTERLKEFDRSDRVRVARNDAQNDLESYAYYAKDFLTNSDFESVSTAAQRAEISKLLDATRDWMDSSSEVAKATREIFKEKFDGLKKLIQPIQDRRKEGSSRPEKISALKKSLDETGKLLLTLESQVQSAITAQSKAAELAKSSSTSTSAEADSSTTAAASDEFDDLEESEGSSSSSTTAAPKYSQPADFNPYTNIDLTDVRETYDSINKWLVEKEAEQAKLKPFEEPALSVKDIEAKAERLGAAMQDLVYKQMRAAQPPPKKSKTSKTKSAKKTKRTSTASDETEPVESPVDEATKPESTAGDSKVNGDEGLDDILNRLKEAGADDPAHPRDEL